MRLPLALLGCSAFVIGCGGSVLFQEGEGGGGEVATAGAIGTTVGSAGDGGGASGVTSGVSTVSGSGGASSGSTTASNGTSSGVSGVTTGSGDSTSSAGGAPPTSSSGGGTPIACGMVDCVGGDICCGTLNGLSCTQPNACNGASLYCAGAANCDPDQVCCLTGSLQSQTAQCQSDCPGGFSGVQLCQGDDECPEGVPCQPGFGGFNVCFAGMGPGGP